MNKRPFILITNDDGINAQGIKYLWESVHEFADVAILAPAHEKSGAGLSITWTKPLTLLPANWPNFNNAWSLSGTPADCVKIACSKFLDRTPDMIISGINRGSNAGRTIFYSGTVGGVIEGTLKNIPGIAFSFCDLTFPSTNIVKKYIHSLVSHFLENPLPQGSFLNVNFPPNCESSIKGFKFAKQGRGYWIEDPEKRAHPEGNTYFWLGGQWNDFPEESESDVALLSEGFITAVPIRINDLTDHLLLQKHKTIIEKEINENSELFPAVETSL